PARLAICPDREGRGEGIQRLPDRGGPPGEDGGIEAWRGGGGAGGRAPDQWRAQGWVVPGGRLAVDPYDTFARRASWQEAASSSLTELFAPQIHQSRLDSWPQHYPWIDPAGYEYFRTRLGQARRDVEHGLAITLQHYTTRAGQERMLEILQFKLDILWSMLDAMSMAYELNRPPYHSVTQDRVWHKGITL
ncbi:pyrroloquinoline quinone biosynthesis protein C, partial [Pseudomonas juntendi]|uniref:pyrroloquinoline quinone biosynthesis protein C n=1 Tax=Pseudomonas juntendi TaxID=2666183 RepID=UPI00301CADA7